MKPFGPRPEDAPVEKCDACHELFKEGDYTALVPLGPGADKEDRRRYHEGRAGNVVCAHLHYACAFGVEYDG